MGRNTIARSMHDVGLAAWFGGTLANAVALNAAAGEARDGRTAGAVANVGWDRWTPINAVAIGAHLVGSTGMLAADADRMRSQQGVASMALLKTALTAAALGATAYSRALGKKVSQHTEVPVESGTEPTSSTPSAVADAQRQLSMLQWVVPVLTGALVVVSAYAGEQQRPSEVHKGLIAGITG
jgi:hypothetical protein